MSFDEDSIAPDIETASEGYRKRFIGRVGEYFLQTQAKAVLSLLPSAETRLRVLEIGGGHGQLTEHFLAAGHEVWVQGSNASALLRIRELEQKYKGLLHSLESPLCSVPFADGSFDVVVAVRIAAHVPELRGILREWIRLTRKRVIFDYPPFESFNALYPVLFRIKKLAEKNTRVFEIYRSAFVESELDSLGWRITDRKRQFFFPMVFHRALGNASLSAKLEELAAAARITSLFGSPAVVAAEPAVPPPQPEASQALQQLLH